MLTYLLERNLLATSELLKSKPTMIALLNDTKLDLWRKVILKNMALIMKKMFAPVARMTYVCSLLAITTAKQWPLLQIC